MLELVRHETCTEYLERRLGEGWKCVSRRGYQVVLQSPEGIIRPVDLRNDIETLRPSAPGDEAALDAEGAAANWDCVDEAVRDNLATRVNNYDNVWERDFYNIDNHVAGSGVINNITVFAWCYTSDVPTQTSIKIAIKSGVTPDEGPEEQLAASTTWELFSNQWLVNPDTLGAFTWGEIDSLQIGISMRIAYAGGESLCTQEYVEVDYTPGGGFVPRPSGSAGGVLIL